MKCVICKRTIKKRERHFSILLKNGIKKYACGKCGNWIDKQIKEDKC